MGIARVEANGTITDLVEDTAVQFNDYGTSDQVRIELDAPMSNGESLVLVCKNKTKYFGSFFSVCYLFVCVLPVCVFVCAAPLCVFLFAPKLVLQLLSPRSHLASLCSSKTSDF